jgi:hypothetical protein
MASGQDAANNSSRLESTQQPKMSPPSLGSYGLGALSGSQNGEGSSMPHSGKQPCPFSRVAEFLWDNLDFIQAGFHIGRYVTTSVNSEAEQENIKALYSTLETTSAQINVSV